MKMAHMELTESAEELDRTPLTLLTPCETLAFGDPAEGKLRR